MKKSYLILASVLILTSLVYSQEKSSIQFSGGIVYPISSSSGLSGTIQYNYNINSRFNFFVSADYSSWDETNFNYIDKSSMVGTYKTGYSESDHAFSRIMAGGRYLITQDDQFNLFVDAGIGYSYLKFNVYDMKENNNPDGSIEVLFTPAGKVSENLFNISSGIGFIHPMTERWDILFEYRLNTYLNSQYHGLLSSNGTFSNFQLGFNCK
ncbi:MAG: outer membrane beta-barrel protein, partial [Ignavibacteriaceae bacterium]|nr:outer membrane beta-barrel protein [Ignavibacteriaceae bacterium]